MYKNFGTFVALNSVGKKERKKKKKEKKELRNNMLFWLSPLFLFYIWGKRERGDWGGEVGKGEKGPTEFPLFGHEKIKSVSYTLTPTPFFPPPSLRQANPCFCFS